MDLLKRKTGVPFGQMGKGVVRKKGGKRECATWENGRVADRRDDMGIFGSFWIDLPLVITSTHGPSFRAAFGLSCSSSDSPLSVGFNVGARILPRDDLERVV